MIAIVLSLSILLPSAVKLSHVFLHHEHEVCENDNNGDTHFHQVDLECEFYKFKLSKSHYYLVYDYDDNTNNIIVLESLPYYFSTHNHQHLTRHLRGPPSLI